MNYLKSNPLCERCKAKGLIVPAVICHHKIYLTDENYKEPSIALNPQNLEAVCRECHNTEHHKDKQRRWEWHDGQLYIKE